jgi:uncharacterized protein (TIGR00369 family)
MSGHDPVDTTATATPLNPGQPVAGVGRTVPFLELLSVRRESMDGGVAVVALELRDDLLNQHGSGHAGVVMTLLESAMAHAALGQLDIAREVETIDMHVGFMRRASGRLVATGRTTGGGRSVCFCEAELVDGSGAVVARGMGTFRLRSPMAAN